MARQSPTKASAQGARSRVRRFVSLLACIIFAPLPIHAQVSFTSAVELAVTSSGKVKSAEGDVKKAQAALAVTKDIYIPSVVATGGAGDSYGITLSVPTIFTVNAQSLIFSFQQRSYVRAARSDLKAAQLALLQAQQEAQEDAAITYISLAEAESTVRALSEQRAYSEKLASIVQDRVNAGLDDALTLKKTRRDALQLKLQQMQAEDAVEDLRGHLAALIGSPADDLDVLPDSIPNTFQQSSDDAAVKAFIDNPGLLAAEASAQAKLERARGDAQYAWKPQITFGAQYGRVSPINDVSQFYNLHGNYNTANIGLQVQFPIIDRVRKAASEISLADAARAKFDLGGFRADQASGQRKLARSIPELDTKAQIAELNFGIARDELAATNIRLQNKDGSAPLTPKEEASAHIEERQKYLELLDARLQLQKAQLSYLRQNGKLSDWLHALAQNRSGTGESPPARK